LHELIEAPSRRTIESAFRVGSVAMAHETSLLRVSQSSGVDLASS